VSFLRTGYVSSGVDERKANKRHAAYTRLNDWLLKNIPATEDALMQTQVVFGPSGSYFAMCGDRMTYSGIPKQLRHELDRCSVSGLGKPTCIALGVKSTYVALWSSGVASWSLGSKDKLYPSLHPSAWKGDARPAFVALSPIKEGIYFTQTVKGQIYYGVRGQQPKQLFSLAMKYMQNRAREDRKTFRVAMSLHTGKQLKASKKMDITPRSRFDVVENCKKLFL